METIEIKISELKPYPKNAKKHPPEQVKVVAQSIKEFGWAQPIVVDENNEILIGHGRYKAAKLLKLETAPCYIIKGLTEEQKKKLRLIDNKSNESDWDLELLKEELLELDFSSFPNINWGVILPEEEKEIIEDEAPEVDDTVEPTVKIGDIWQLGEHKLICGDSTDINVVAKLCENEKVDLLLTDPPYNVDYEGKTKEKLRIENDKMGDEVFREFLSKAFNASDSVMKPGAVFYIWHADSEGFNFRGACRDAGWIVRQCLIWNKNSMVMGRQDYHWKHEPCLYGWKDGAGHLWASDRKQTTILNFDRPSRNADHPTMKPVALFAYQIKNNTKGQDVVLDMFGGSGTTLIACEQLGRKARIVELDPKYCDVIIKRWENLTNNKAVKL